MLNPITNTYVNKKILNELMKTLHATKYVIVPYFVPINYAA